jgi:hypothetical protein
MLVFFATLDPAFGKAIFYFYRIGVLFPWSLALAPPSPSWIAHRGHRRGHQKGLSSTTAKRPARDILASAPGPYDDAFDR